MANEVLIREGRWSVVKTAEDEENAEVMHNCDVDVIEVTYLTLGDEKCYGCDAKVPEHLQTVALMYSKNVANKRKWGKSQAEVLDKVMKGVFWTMMKESPLFSGGKLTNITAEDPVDS